jgi:hypothetical protein
VPKRDAKDVVARFVHTITWIAIKSSQMPLARR